MSLSANERDGLNRVFNILGVPTSRDRSSGMLRQRTDAPAPADSSAPAAPASLDAAQACIDAIGDMDPQDLIDALGEDATVKLAKALQSGAPPKSAPPSPPSKSPSGPTPPSSSATDARRRASAAEVERELDRAMGTENRRLGISLPRPSSRGVTLPTMTPTEYRRRQAMAGKG